MIYGERTAWQPFGQIFFFDFAAAAADAVAGARSYERCGSAEVALG